MVSRSVDDIPQPYQYGVAMDRIEKGSNPPKSYGGRHVAVKTGGINKEVLAVVDSRS